MTNALHGTFVAFLGIRCGSVILNELFIVWINGKNVTLIGINFSLKKRTIDMCAVESV